MPLTPTVRPALLLTLVAVLGSCSSSGGSDDDGGGAGASSGGATASGGSSSNGGSSTGGSSASGGSSAGASAGTNASGATGGSATGGSAGTSSCVTERVVLAQSQTTSSCGWELPGGVDGWQVNVFVGPSGSGSGSLVCRRASSQGCDPSGWWLTGSEIALCDETCISFNDNPGLELSIEIGCDSDTCL